LAQELRRSDLSSVGQHGEVGQTQVDANVRVDLRERTIGGLDDE
jgi:hypothetical protein